MEIKSFYEKNYKKLIFIPLALLIIAFILIGVKIANTGDFANKDVSLAGGIDVTINKEGINYNDIKEFLESKFDNIEVRELTDLATRENAGINIKIVGVEEDELKNVLNEKVKLNYNDPNEYSASNTSARFGESFYNQLIIIILVAFLLMGIVVLIAYRSFIPSVAVISAALMDIVITLAILNLVGFKLSSAGIVAFLLVIGYSIDTDVLLTTRMLKRKEGSYLDRMVSSMKTGLTMTITTMAALTVALIVSISPVLQQMFTIVIIALVIDIISTYFFNAPILMMYCKKKRIA